MTTTIIRFAALASLLGASACGPAVVGLVVDDAQGRDTPELSEASVVPGPIQASIQVAHDATLIAIAVNRPEARPIRLRLEYDLGDGEGPRKVPPSDVERIDAASNPLPLASSGDSFELATSATVEVYLLLWQHGRTLGRVEVRNVDLDAVFVDASRPPGFARAVAAKRPLLTNATIGRELGNLADVELTRKAATDPESEFVVAATLLDRGGDRDITEFEFAFALTSAAPTSTDWVVLGEVARQNGLQEPRPDGFVESALEFTIDPLVPTNSIPLGQHERLWLRIRHREVYPAERGSGTVAPFEAETVSSLAEPNANVGYAPLIQAASIVDPSAMLTRPDDPGSPWLRLPVVLDLRNPSPTQAMEVDLRGEYRIDGAWRPATPFERGDPQSQTLVALAPLERKTHFFVWNVVRDEGLGLRFSDPRVAEVRVTAARRGSPLETAIRAGFSMLNTNPFVSFRANLLPDAIHVWPGSEPDGATRDLFFTRKGANTQETLVGLSQQFAARQILPPPPPFDLGLSNGVTGIVATDSAMGPDCIVRAARNFYYVSWPKSCGGICMPTGALLPGATADHTPGDEAFAFELTGANGVYRVAMFTTWVRSGANLDVELNAVVLDPQQDWYVQNQQATIPLVSAPPMDVPIRIATVGGEFDGDPSTWEVVLGNAGTEFLSPGHGLLHMWHIGLSGSTPPLAISATPEALPRAPAIEAADDDARVWRLAGWDPGDGKRGLVLVRELLPRVGSTTRHRLDVHLLDRTASGGFAASWRAIAPADGPEVSAGSWNLQRIFAEDLDGSSGGIPGSDLLAVLSRPYGQGQRAAEVWLLAPDAGPVGEWRRIVEDLRALDPHDLQPPPNDAGNTWADRFQLADVNGDRRLDLLTCESVGNSSSDPSHFNYLASSLSSVAGRLGELQQSAGNPFYRSLRPGLIDANRDGYDDLITGGRLHLANLEGSYTPTIGGFRGGSHTIHRVERIHLGGNEDSTDVLAFDPASGVGTIDRLDGLGSPDLTVSPAYDFTFAANGRLFDVRAWMRPTSTAHQIKDLIGLVEPPPTGSSGAQLFSIDLANAPSPEAFSAWPGGFYVEAGMALVRREPLSPTGEGSERATQDIAVVDANDHTRIIVFESHMNYATRVVTLDQDVVRIAEASVGSDAFEDLCVLTTEQLANDSVVFRVLCIEQDPDPTKGVGRPAAITTLAEFEAPFAESAVRAFAFDRRRDSRAGGFLLIDDDDPEGTRSEIRLLQSISGPNEQPDVRVIRSPLDQDSSHPLQVIVSDSNLDGVLEVVGGEDSTAPSGLKHMVTNGTQGGS
ncbi:MAG: hypothetical protein KDE27_10010 [Planctomycetes bacterium]|nr:hypothetical protein [Planctomycetota bacterium]